MNYKRNITIVFMLLAVIISLSILSCRTLAGQPEIKKVEVIPNEIYPGDTAVIQVVVKDKHHIVQKVEGIVKEDPRIKLRLRDDGIEPDKKANDGIWILKVDVPNEVMPGEFMLEITAYRKDGLPIKVRHKEEKIVTLKKEIPIVIKSKN
ncbi:MAG TPA: hypothetical protein PLJ10_10315 [Candidatus Hydrogenedens sp.]|nr:hypothetical protein [Candidatus Hydrogenedens sp.]HOL19965.1 hypothetical protein [Candidatus Hydrogenedens sp.]